ncbi:unnamed protein product [Heligmosomoides polygyrus]|uniref:Uncharacterized protein n=1 Tax=Heligmosomoides polygyrus TaxID=6339 RepID=A0A3P8B1J5_HELPZ|nr:unnamed protein product [Heligmosomoides polygyrus]
MVKRNCLKLDKLWHRLNGRPGLANRTAEFNNYGCRAVDREAPRGSSSRRGSARVSDEYKDRRTIVIVAVVRFFATFARVFAAPGFFVARPGGRSSNDHRHEIVVVVGARGDLSPLVVRRSRQESASGRRPRRRYNRIFVANSRRRRRQRRRIAETSSTNSPHLLMKALALARRRDDDASAMPFQPEYGVFLSAKSVLSAIYRGNTRRPATHVGWGPPLRRRGVTGVF